MIAVASSNLAGVDYSDWTGILTIAFHSGGIYEFDAVPRSVFVGLMQAQSHGKFFHAHIKNRYNFRRIK